MTGPIAGRGSWLDRPCSLLPVTWKSHAGWRKCHWHQDKEDIDRGPPSLLVQRAPPSLHRGLCGAPSELAAPWLADVCPGERLRDSDPQHPDLKTGRIAPSSENAHGVSVWMCPG